MRFVFVLLFFALIGNLAFCLPDTASLTSPQYPFLKKLPMIDPREFGCVGDGVTDDTVNMNLAEDYAYAKGMGIYIPGSCTFALTGRFGFRVDVISNGGGFIAANATDGLEISNKATGKTPQYGSGTVFAGFSVNPRAKSRGIYLSSGENLTLRDIRVENAVIGGIGCYLCDNLLIENCRVASVSYTSGAADGIYLGACPNSTIRHCEVQDFRRIGIVSEGEGSIPGENVTIENNDVHGAHNSDDSPTEYNAGIWLENTNGGDVLYNEVTDIGGNAGQTAERVYGIVLTGGQTRPCVVNAKGNRIDIGGEEPGFYLRGNDRLVTQNVTDNEIASCARPFLVIGGQETLTIENNKIHNCLFTADGNGVLYYSNDSTTSSTWTLNYRQNSVASITFSGAASDSATLNFFLNHPVILNLENLASHSVVMRTNYATNTIRIKGCDLFFATASSSYNTLTANKLEIDSSSFSSFPNRGGTNVFRFGDGSFNKTKFHDPFLLVMASERGNSVFTNCGFASGTYVSNQTNVDGTLLAFVGCVSDGINASFGLLYQNFYANASETVQAVGNIIHKNGLSTGTVFLLRSFSPDASNFVGNVYPDTLDLTNFSGASETANMPVPF